ncbi:hypothetical protein PEBR_30282 [Penicillium brasilianum]|uniref:Uncharacterized protein n=1 Tax=Penicillium brasilianum TaxID=104259 RepID=A0A1S9RG22_PENBI|nr:hypothetical protein PEBR_30282 [Penicillium brasilianum]
MIDRGLCTEEMLYSALVFLEIESYSCPEGMEGWYTHAIGAYALIKRFAKLLMVLIISSLNVSGEEYKQIVQSCGETPLDGLVKLYADSAIIAQAADFISPLDYRACQLLLHHSLAHENNIIAWYEQIKDEIGGAPQECAEDELLCSGLARDDDLFGTPYRFASLENARIHILVWNLLRDLQPYIYKARMLVKSFIQDSLPKNQLQSENQQLAIYYADQMARSVLYCVQDDFKSCGVQCLIFCLCQTAKTWIDVKKADKITWCQEIFDFAAGLGFDYANRLKETMMSQWIQAEQTDSDALSPNKEPTERVGEESDVAGVSELAALPGMLGKPSMLDVPGLSSMSPTAKLPDARFAVTVPVRERGSIQ